MSGGRDISKGKLYRAEREWWNTFGPTDGTKSHPNHQLNEDELVPLLERLLVLGGAKITRVEFDGKPGGALACYRGVRHPRKDSDEPLAHRFSFKGRRGRVWVAIHEVAHALVKERTSERAYYSHAVLSHGWQFVEAYVDLASLFYDAGTAMGLSHAMRKGGVRMEAPTYYRFAVTNPDWGTETEATRHTIAATADQAARATWWRPAKRRAPRRDRYGFFIEAREEYDSDLVVKKGEEVSYEDLLAFIEEKGARGW